MAKINFTKLGIKKNTEVTEIDINGQKVEVLQYLPIEDKTTITELVLQECLEHNFINMIEVEKYLHLYVVYKYTNISFTAKQKEDENALYDMLESSGLIDSVVGSCYEDYEVLKDFVFDYIEKYEKYQNTAYGMISKIMGDIPESMSEAVEKLEGLDLTKLNETLQIAVQNGGSI